MGVETKSECEDGSALVRSGEERDVRSESGSSGEERDGRSESGRSGEERDVRSESGSSGENARLRAAELADAEAILRIYEPYILETTITFEYEPIAVEQFQARMAGYMARFPWLVLETAAGVVGYAYASPHFSRAAYAWTCEVSVYVDRAWTGHGYGRRLYEALLPLLYQQGIYHVYALISVPNAGSVALHRACGFTELALYEKVGFKHGVWCDLLIMDRQLRPCVGTPAPVDTNWRALIIGEK